MNKLIEEEKEKEVQVTDSEKGFCEEGSSLKKQQILEK